MWPFKRRPLIDPETADWHLENFEGLVRCYAENESLADANLLLPKPGFFPNDGERGHALAERIFGREVSPWRPKLGTYRSVGRNVACIYPNDGKEK